MGMACWGRNCVLWSMRAVNVAQRKSKFESIIWGSWRLCLKPLWDCSVIWRKTVKYCHNLKLSRLQKQDENRQFSTKLKAPKEVSALGSQPQFVYWCCGNCDELEKKKKTAFGEVKRELKGRELSWAPNWTTERPWEFMSKKCESGKDELSWAGTALGCRVPSVQETGPGAGSVVSSVWSEEQMKYKQKEG